jgi:hypothetical protein
MNFFANVNQNGLTNAGTMGQNDLMALQKALEVPLEAGYGSDVSTLTGGSALRIQSLDLALQATVQENRHFALFNKLPKPRATAVLDEWTEQHSIGGFFGSTFNTQDGAAMQTAGQYQRMVGQVKYMTTYRSIPVVLQQQNNIVDAVTIETTNGTKQLLTDIEVGLFEGNSSVIPLSFDGIAVQIESLGSDDHVIDMRGAALSSIDPISTASAVIFGFGNFGRATDIFVPPSVQQDLNTDLDPAFRVIQDGQASQTVRGTAVTAIQTSYGTIRTNTDVFIRDEKLKQVFQVRAPWFQAIAAGNNYQPASLAGVAATYAGTLFSASQLGDYFYGVTGVTNNGESLCTVSAQVAVAAGQAVTLTIGKSVAGSETGYVLYRGSLNGPAQSGTALGDLREMVRVPYAGGATTTHVDYNQDIPGSTMAYILNLSESDHAIAWRQYLPMMKIAMAAVNSPIIPWLQMICGYLRISKRNQHVVIKNIVPNSAAWVPFPTVPYSLASGL